MGVNWVDVNTRCVSLPGYEMTYIGETKFWSYKTALDRWIIEEAELYKIAFWAVVLAQVFYS